MIDRQTIQRILDASDIVEVVKEFVTLRKAGVNYKGLCPFHNERTPSFVVSPSKQLCKCFSCGKGGDVVHFVMEHEHMSYPEALRWLAAKHGIAIEEREMDADERRAQSERASMLVLNEWACKFFERTLREDVDGVALGMAYLRSRGFRDDIIRKFRLGFSPESRDALAKAAAQAGFNPELLEKTGLCFRTERGELLDRFHGRVIFPVLSVSGATVAFGGRILGQNKNVGKYVNSPESLVYSKSRELYGLYQAKQAIVREDHCFLVEGYTDVMSMHQCGIENVVASSGTSLTDGQIRLLHRFTEHITVLYDGDSAGIKASMRGIDMLLREGMKIRALLLPDGDDPDSFARKHTAASYRAYIDQHQEDFIRFKARLLLGEAGDDPMKRAELVSNVIDSIAVIPDNVLRQGYVAECARLFNTDESLVQHEVATRIRRQRIDSREKPSESGTAGADEQNATQEGTPQTGDETTGTARQPGVTVENTSGSTPTTQTGFKRPSLRRLDAVAESERLLAACVVRYGNKTLAVPTEDESEPLSMTVAQYVHADLEQDGLTLTQPVVARIVEEASQMSADDDASRYFLVHPDAEISSFASSVMTPADELSASQKQGYVEDGERLTELVPRLLHDLKYQIVRRRLADLLQRMKSEEVLRDTHALLSLMEEYKALSEIEREFARILGERVLTL